MPYKFDTKDTFFKGGRLVTESKPFPGPLKRNLETSYTLMPILIGRCVNLTTAGTIAWPLYRRWFDPAGVANQSNVRFVRSVFATLNQWSTTKALTFFFAEGNQVSRLNSTMGAYCVTLTLEKDSKVVHEGSGVRIGFSFLANIFQPRDLAGFVLHELTHKLGKSIGRDILDHKTADGTFAYGSNSCLRLAMENAAAAITNADNYRCYMKEANDMDFMGPLGI
jgi:hypothetical protein